MRPPISDRIGEIIALGLKHHYKSAFLHWKDILMAIGNIYKGLCALKAQGKSGFAVLADPDKVSPAEMEYLARLCNDAGVDYLMVGGSLLMAHQMETNI